MTPKIAIVGAGAAGLACAAAMADRGVTPKIFEKSRGYGGRMATRRRDGVQFDHGAQFLRIDDDPYLQQGVATGALVRWPSAKQEDGNVPWVGAPRMKDVLAQMADAHDIHYGSEIKTISQCEGQWNVTTDDDSASFDGVVLAATAPQSLRVLAPEESTLRTELETVHFAPCHALMVAFDEAPTWPDFQRTPPEPFALILNDSSKPGRPAGPTCIVAHTTASWSERHLDTTLDDIASILLDHLASALGPLPTVAAAMGHRWRFSQATQPLGRAYAENSDGTLLAGGDWALGRNVEDALTSGRAMAGAICARFGY